MSLEQVIEADIARFLDGAVTPVERRDAPRQEDAAYAYANKDWELEIRNLLKRNDLEAAKKLFNELKERYNQAPADHHEERRKLYETVQACYLQIVNYSTDRQRTTELLQNMEQGPTDVFNINVRSVNLQAEDRNAQPSASGSGMGHGHQAAPAAPNIIVVQAPPQMPQGFYAQSQQPAPQPPPRYAPQPQPPAGSPLEPLPPPPAVPQTQVIMAAAAMQANPQSSGPAAGASGPSINVSTGSGGAPMFRQEKTRDEIVSASVRKSLQDAMTLSKSDPGAALTLLKGIGDTVMNEEQAGRLTHATASLLIGQIESLEHAMRAGEDRHRFGTEFNASLSSLTHLARTKHEDAVLAYESLRDKAESFEKSYPAYAGEFTARLDTVQQQYSLLDEDAIVERLSPILIKIKMARSQGDRRGMLEALEDLSHFTNTLPHVQERVLLENVVSKLRARALGVKPAPPSFNMYSRSSAARDERPIL